MNENMRQSTLFIICSAFTKYHSQISNFKIRREKSLFLFGGNPSTKYKGTGKFIVVIVILSAFLHLDLNTS